MADFSGAEAAQRYKNAENATGPYAKIIVGQSGIAAYLNSGAEANVLDFACGTGVVAQKLYDMIPKEKWRQLKVLGADISPPMLEYSKARGEKQGWVGLETKIVDGNGDFTQALPKSSFTHIFTTFALNMLPEQAISHLYSLLHPGGFIAVATWSTIPWHILLTRSIALMDAPQPYSPSHNEFQEKLCGPWAAESHVVQQLEGAGLERVGSSAQKERVRAGTPKVFMGSMQFPLQFVVKTWWEGERDGIMEELSDAMKEIVEGEVGEDGEVGMEFDGVMGWEWKSG
ncbi:hypothetical protein G6011_03071 [Alternaria panax]|uniref:Methyltransferase domain-containing protein n=1 Tax=Alternaria panax TaxID=48097 RepID=A0AAD4IEN1_9PLEO|nr:hypothetical protein G6011_03071 [Alternaria panax]